MDIFELASGSIVGRDHVGRGNVLKGLNNQDGHSLLLPGENPGLFGAVVCDGCGSGEKSEVGAAMGPDLLLTLATRLYPRYQPAPGSYETDPLSPDFWTSLHALGLAEIDRMIRAQLRPGRSYRQVLEEKFRFTVCGVLIDPQIGAWIFYDADGVYAINGRVTVIESRDLDPQGRNVPSYWVYALDKGNEFYSQVKRTAFKVVFQPIADLESVLVGTDGVADLIRIADQNLPGKQDQTVGPLSQFWTEARYFDPEMPGEIHLRLRMINREPSDFAQGKRHAGLLHDDTTLAVVRRHTST